ncbi:selenoprotein M-like [Leptopilina boulardi]|uniref:selenoprotein M-like n=1 Tax=Leptopilina boulardi TaxID=63433 RepID=UPI0021F63C51|nr:selenoprotein M-like [Leptopilina boulardi]
MFPVRYILCIFLLFLSFSLSYAGSGNYAFAKVESCRGCSLNSLPDVKSFIFNDLPLYEDVEFKHIQGAKPELIFYDKNDEEIERLALSQLMRDECNELLLSKGFKKRQIKDEV